MEQPRTNDANSQALRSLQEALAAGRVFGLVGAGSSVRAGYPTWNGLLKLMEEAILSKHSLLSEVLASLQGEADALWRAQEYRRLLGEEEYGILLRETFSDGERKFTEFHEKLVRLPLRHILTTNYDPILELAHTAVFKEPARRIQWDDAWDLREFIFRAGDPGYARRYVYLHGRFNNPGNIILTEQDYQNRYVLSERDADRIAALMATQQVLSIGFSLADFDLMEIYRQVKARMGPGRPHHYALLPISEDQNAGLVRRRLNGKFGVEPVFYPFSPDHAALDRVLDDLLEAEEIAEEKASEAESFTPPPPPPEGLSREFPLEGPNHSLGKAVPPRPQPKRSRPSHAAPSPSVLGPESGTGPQRPDEASVSESRVRVFLSYSQEDARQAQTLAERLAALGQDLSGPQVALREVSTGTDWNEDYLEQLERADLILLLVSPALLASDYVYNIELKRGLERQEKGEAQVIPILLRPADWSSAPFAKLRALPGNGKPVSSWDDEAKAWQNVVEILGQALT